MQSEINLEQIRPQDAEIIVDGETVVLRKFNGMDEAWLRETFGTDPDVLKQISDEKLYRIIFHQMRYEDQVKFGSKTTLKMVNDNGETIEEVVAGWKAFSAHLFGLREKVELLNTLGKLVGLSRPLLTDEEKKELAKQTSDLKKKSPKTGRK